jgi:hypothetical protein
MKRIILLLIALLAAAWAAGCGGTISDGGQSGTGISTIRGNVVAAMGTQLELADIRVSVTDTTLTTHTDAGGRFELRGSTSGAAELRFERARDGLFARTDVVIPAGGVLELSEVELDPDDDEARPRMRRVEFEGFVASLDCAGGTIVMVAKEDEAGSEFTVDVASATIRADDMRVTCGDVRVGDRVQVEAETPDGSTLINATVVLEDREDERDDSAAEADEADRAADDDAPDRAALRPRRVPSDSSS